MTDSPDRTLEHLRVDAKLLSEISEIMARNGRRVVIKLDDRKIDSLSTVTPSDISSAKEVDVSSFWVNPERPHFGRRHFVYFLAEPGGAKYFGDSMSPEVTKVCEDLDVYFGRVTAPSRTTATAVAPSPAAYRGWRPTGWVFETQERFIAAACLAGVLIALVAFLIGRWTAPTPTYVAPVTAPAPVTDVPPDVAPGVAPPPQQ